MINPILALCVFGLIAGILGFFFWTDLGLYWRWRRLYWKSELVDAEDALKHLHDWDYLSRTATIESLVGSLGISTNRAVDLTQRLHALGLLVTRDGALHLTPNGRRSALRVVRSHRLWERYLADRTGLNEKHWHAFADRLEHTTSSEELEALSSRLGSPRYDPHGDPIPTATGDVPAARGQVLTGLSVGQLAKIVHVEDEPESIYAQLVAEGLHPGMLVRVIETSPSRVRLEADGEEFVLAPIVAANLAVILLAKEAVHREPFQRLLDLNVSEHGKVARISPACRGPQMRRLLDLGFVPGTAVEAELVSPGGGLTAYRVRGALIALRKDQARMVYVTRAAQEKETA